MMKMKQVLSGVMAGALLLLPVGSALAEQAQLVIAEPNSAIIEEQKMGYYAFFTGTIQEIHTFEGAEGGHIVLVKAKDGNIANFFIHKDTVLVDGATLKEGNTITGYYRANAPMLMIYPPQYNVEFVLKGQQALQVDADIYDADLLNQAGTLKLNIGDNTKIVRADGSAYEGSLIGRKLIVHYDVTTRSLPAQTTPKKVIVLDDAVLGKDAPLYVNGEAIKAPAPYTNKDGVAMIPLDASLKALGRKWLWNAKLNIGVLDGQYVLRGGKDWVLALDSKELTELGAAFECKDDVLYAPLGFFRTVLQLDEAQAFGGGIYLAMFE